MAINENVMAGPIGAGEKAAARSREHKFFLVGGLLFAALVFIGFSKMYYLKFLFDTPPMHSNMVRVHGLIMTAWVLLFAAQAWLVSAKQVRLHMKLGWAGAAMAVLILVTGYLVSIGAAVRLAGADWQGIPPLVFLIVPLADLVMFVIFFGGAIALRKKPADHKRLMLLTAANFLPPAAARTPVEALQALGPIWFFGLPTVFLLGAIAYDYWQNRKVNKLFLAGSLLLVASFPARMVIGETETWNKIAVWLTT